MNVTQEQTEIAQALAQGFFQSRFLNQATADQGKTAGRHAMAVEIEEFVVQVLDQDQPEPGKGRGRHPGPDRLEHCRIDTGLAQQSLRPLRLVAQGVQHAVDEVNRDCIVFPHGGFRKVWQKIPDSVNSYGIGPAKGFA
ncbi:hypothetical protein D3C84_512470 [compost metagenome]